MTKTFPTSPAPSQGQIVTIKLDKLIAYLEKNHLKPLPRGESWTYKQIHPELRGVLLVRKIE